MSGARLEALVTPVAWSASDVQSLADWSVRNVLSPAGLDLDSYGTLRALARSPTAPRRTVADCPIGSARSVLVERLPRSWTALARAQGADLAGCDSMRPDLRTVVGGALQLVRRAEPRLFASIHALLRTIHVLRSRRPDYDVSFTLPELPHSAFVSVAPEGPPYPRLAEALVHEALHLQLALVERQSALVHDEAERAYAPWRGEMRPLSGFVHGLFVFGNIERFWSCVLADGATGSATRRFAEGRVAEIRSQLRPLPSPESFRSLTHIGRRVWGGAG